jgi:SAM-dependent methyltransferase
VLHLGAGRDSLDVVRGVGDGVMVVSADPDLEGLAKNRNCKRVCCEGTALPFPDGSFSVVAFDHVFEHLADPLSVLCECYRCLKAGGRVVFICPNRYSYLGILTRATPHWFHQRFKRHLMGVDESDVFPAYYRLNHPGAIRRLAARAGLRVERIDSYVGWPTYWEFSDFLHRGAVVLHWMLERMPRWTHITLVGVLRKD